jgi:hypothetical protein
MEINMAILAPLWLPILVSAVVFISSTPGWMALGRHNADIKKLPDESALLDLVRRLKIPPGTYMWPSRGASE